MIQSNSCNLKAVMISKMSIERCQGYLAHLHALMYLSGEDEADDLVMESVLKVMENIKGELEHSSKALGAYE